MVCGERLNANLQSKEGDQRADKDTIYEEAAPMLFGDLFAKEAKIERISYGLWTEPLDAQGITDPKSFRTAALAVFAEGAGGMNPGR